jgi:hypothetical protein
MLGLRVRWQERWAQPAPAAAATRPRDVSARAAGAPPPREASQTVIERRAADVLVLGGGPVAQCAAYTLARSGRKVILDRGDPWAHGTARP